MTTFEQAGDAMLRLHEANRSMAQAFGSVLGRVFSRNAPGTADNLLSHATFFQQEPDLAKESHLPGTYA